MTKLEKVVNGLEIVWNGMNAIEHELYADYVYDALELLKAQRWISVKDRLPENNRFVLVCNDDGHMMVAQYIEETAQWQYKYINYDVDVWDDEEQGPVCWWAELPEPPKESEDGDK